MISQEEGSPIEKEMQAVVAPDQEILKITQERNNLLQKHLNNI